MLPVLPTTPFMLLAAFCFMRASPRLHQRLLRSRTFGPMIREWEQHRAIPWRTKLTAIALMSVTMAASIYLFVRPWPLQTRSPCWASPWRPGSTASPPATGADPAGAAATS